MAAERADDDVSVLSVLLALPPHAATASPRAAETAKARLLRISMGLLGKVADPSV
jgi:hypothetical protein